MHFTSEQKIPKKEEGRNYIFLAGSIDYMLPSIWREKVIEKSDDKNIFFDPTNKDYQQLNEKEMIDHIEWELNAMSLADKILLNFLPASLSPISLVEFGLYVSSKKLIVICPKGFYQSRYIHKLCKEYNATCYFDLNKAIKELQ